MDEQEPKITETTKPKILRALLDRAPHKNGFLIVNYPPFGPGTFEDNVASMGGKYGKYSSDSNIANDNEFSFDELTTAESISAFYKYCVIRQRFQIGRIVRTSDGVYANPPKGTDGNSILDEQTLRTLRDSCKNINGIYLGENDFGFAPYESFKPRVQESDTFIEGGLARVLEHTDGKTAKQLGVFALERISNGVTVDRFEPVDKPRLKVVLFNLWDYPAGRQLEVDNGDLDYAGGYAFGKYCGKNLVTK